MVNKIEVLNESGLGQYATHGVQPAIAEEFTPT
jgi:hypothetical protein